MWKLTLLLVACLVIPAHMQYLAQPLAYEQPTPYSFEYSAPGLDGQSAQQEQGDGYGRVSGSYQLATADGIQRTVQYVADEGGFRANIITNEPGTISSAPAGVNIESSNPYLQ